MARPRTCLLLLCSLVVFLFAGCSSKAPFFNPLAPYGTPRVAPPATGSYSAPDAYYQPPNQPLPAAQPEVPTSQYNRVGRGALSGYAWQPSGTRAARDAAGGITPSIYSSPATAIAGNSSSTGDGSTAGFSGPAGSVVRTAAGEAPVRVVQPTVNLAPTALSLDGMQVNDAAVPIGSGPIEPQRFAPQGRVAELVKPRRFTPVAAPSPVSTPVPTTRVRGLSPRPSPPAAPRTFPSGSPASIPSGPTQLMSNGWRTRIELGPQFEIAVR